MLRRNAKSRAPGAKLLPAASAHDESKIDFGELELLLSHNLQPPLFEETRLLNSFIMVRSCPAISIFAHERSPCALITATQP